MGVIVLEERGYASLGWEERCRIVADYCYDWEYWLGPDGELLFMSPSCERLSGFTLEEFRDDPGLMTRIIQEDDRQIYTAHHNALSENKDDVCSIDVRILHKDGTTRWINHFCRPVFDAQGRYLGRRGTNRDISAFKMEEESLRLNRERFNIIAESTHDVIWDWNVVTGEVWWSPTITEAFGYQPDQVGDNAEWWQSRIHPDDREEVLASVMDCFMARRRNWSGEYRYLKADGSYALILDRGAVVYDENGAPARMLGTEFDLTEFLKLRSRLEEVRSRYRVLAEASPSGIWETDLKGHNTYASDRWSEITGISRENAAGDGWSQGIHPEDREAVRHGWYTTAPLERTYQSEFRFIRPSGETVWVLCLALPVLDDQDQVTGWVGTVTDITSYKDKEHSLAEANRLLEEKIAEIKTLRGILPICSYCNKIRDSQGNWTRLEAYIESRTEAEMSHGICADCRKAHFPEIDLE